MKSLRCTVAMIGVLALCLPALAADEVTVGNFVQRLADSKNLESTDGWTALASLRAAGVSMPADLQLTEPLTEGHVARISRALGLDVSTNRPDRAFSVEQVDRFFSAFRVEAALRGELQPGSGRSGERTPPFNPYSKGKGGGKGKKKGHGFTPSEPE